MFPDFLDPPRHYLRPQGRIYGSIKAACEIFVNIAKYTYLAAILKYFITTTPHAKLAPYLNFLDSPNRILDHAIVQQGTLWANLGYYITLHSTHIWRPSWILDKHTFIYKTNVLIGFLGLENILVHPECILLCQTVATFFDVDKSCLKFMAAILDVHLIEVLDDLYMEVMVSETFKYLISALTNTIYAD